jgi:hypothetical protein
VARCSGGAGAGTRRPAGYFRDTLPAAQLAAARQVVFQRGAAVTGGGPAAGAPRRVHDQVHGGRGAGGTGQTPARPGAGYVIVGSFDEGRSCLSRALALFEQISDRVGRAERVRQARAASPAGPLPVRERSTMPWNAPEGSSRGGEVIGHVNPEDGQLTVVASQLTGSAAVFADGPPVGRLAGLGLCRECALPGAHHRGRCHRGVAIAGHRIRRLQHSGYYVPRQDGQSRRTAHQLQRTQQYLSGGRPGRRIELARRSRKAPGLQGLQGP